MPTREEIRRALEEEAKRRFEQWRDSLREEFEKFRIEQRQRLEELSDRFDFSPPHLIAEERLPEPEAAAAPGAPAKDLAEVLLALSEVDAGTSQVEILRSFLTSCLAHADRAVLLVARGEQLAVWKAEGVSPDVEVALRGSAIPLSSDPMASSAMEGEPAFFEGTCELSRRLSLADATGGVLLPIVVRDKVSALLYADRRGDRSTLDAPVLSILCYAVGATVDRLGTRKLVPAPALRKPRAWQAPSAATVAMPIPEIPRAVFGNPPESAPAPAPEVSFAAPPAAPAAPSPISFTPAVEPASPPPAPKKIDLDGSGAPYRPPTGVIPGGGRRSLGGTATLDEDPHEEARRLARLLVSDIRLYNEAAIEEGKRHNDIYARVKEDIDRARQTYNERVAPDVRSRHDYFRDELIRTLADGRAEALGEA